MQRRRLKAQVYMMCRSESMVKLMKPEIQGSILKYQTLPKSLEGPLQFCVSTFVLVFTNGLPKLYKFQPLVVMFSVFVENYQVVVT